MTTTFYWHDYETFGADPVHDRPAQFAGVRTDADLNIIEDPMVLYCQPTEDYLPDPGACLITGITPQTARSEGVPEAEFISRIHEAFSQPGTCVVGYNSLRFDDEVTRHTLYRNLRDPYAREWQNGNSRWDIIDMVRLTHALRPEGINWPTHVDGTPSFRLEELTEANNIAHGSAHDAMSDVEATIALAKLIRDRQPKLYEYVLSHRDKHSARAMLDLSTFKPVLHVSSMYSAAMGCCALVAPVAQHPVNRNAVIVYDLRHDPTELVNADVGTIRERLFTRNEDMPEGQTRFPLKTVHLNKCPVLVPAAMLKTLSDERQQALALNGDELRDHLQVLRQAPGLSETLAEVYQPTDTPADDPGDPDEQLYSGGFIPPGDRRKLDELLRQPPEFLGEEAPDFEDSRLPEMLFRYRARNYPQSLTPEEQERWEQFRQVRLMKPGRGWRSLEGYMSDLQQRLQSGDLSQRDRNLLDDLYLYGESLIPYV
ncbi:exodeoxyribonuclease I subunit C [Tamilnaduibacter salinus]|uniref:Exodeoxyribonuclease I n=1 Tax=Tamilnaduibacter salinus TaxID=1484056 RepID=A0A2U1D1Z7_9GAMM|nr:exodeoxyribonuclease I [Tamilnaduibacter salinus]PVY79301.1 exodeoxyribonuclease I subunit C [Tamilnaduibacter salinus]